MFNVRPAVCDTSYQRDKKVELKMISVLYFLDRQKMNQQLFSDLIMISVI